jgi:coenzyme Q-binding protein COQ10
MPQLRFTRHVPHPPRKMFDLVADMQAYPRFLPNVSGMTVRQEPGGVAELARMAISFGPITQAYTSRVTADPEALIIRARATDGPFSHLDSTWSFEAEGQGTCVRFEIDFAFSNKLVAAVAEPAFARKQDEIVAAFLKEADRRYGTSG